eukprot:5310944-Pyramimonas_sp.AAC.1
MPPPCHYPRRQHQVFAAAAPCGERPLRRAEGPPSQEAAAHRCSPPAAHTMHEATASRPWLPVPLVGGEA